MPSIPAADVNLVTKNSILNLANLNIPLVGPETKIRMKIFCPQIRKSLIEVPFDESLDSYLDLSKYLIRRLGIDPHLKAILYNKKGQPFLYNLDLMHMRLPKLDFSEELYVMFTDSSSAVDEEVVEPPSLSTEISQISIVRGLEKYAVEIDLGNTLSVLKYRIFKITQIHPQNQIIKFANKPLANNV